MALIERLMHDSSEPTERHIAVHTFFAYCSEIERGGQTLPNVKTLLSTTAADNTDFDAIGALITGAAASRLAVIQRIHAVFILAETGELDYDTPAKVRAKLGI